MSFIVYLGNVSKRVNSTMRPDTSGWHGVSAVWKESKDLDSPTFHLYLPDVDNPRYNYVYIPDENAYYWVTGITTLGNKRWEISATMDLLATYKDNIMATRAYIEYGFNVDTSGAQRRLQDRRQNVSNVPKVYTASADITQERISLYGVYSLAAVGAQGGVTSYIITQGQIRQLLDKVTTDIDDAIRDFESVFEILKYFSQNSLAQGSAISAIRSCIWLPVQQAIYPGEVKRIYLGDFDTGVNGLELGNNPIFKAETDIAIPWPVNDWKRMNCQLLMYVPFIGTVGIPVDQCNNESTLHVTWCIELITGGISVRINAGSYTVYTGTANAGIPYAIGSSNIPIQNAVSGTIAASGGALQIGVGAAGAIAGVATGLWAGAEGAVQGVGQFVSGMQSVASGTMQSLTPVVQCAGSLGGSAAFGQSMEAMLTLLYYEPIDDPGYQGLYGYPVMCMGTPVAGYCKTRNFSVAANARADEIIRINASMDSGVFIE